MAGGVLVVSVVNGALKEVCSAKVRTLGEGGTGMELHVHPQDSSRATYVNHKGDVKWSLSEIEVPTVEQCVREDAIETQDVRELGLGWAWFVNDLHAVLPDWQDMELASPYPDEPVTQIDADVPIAPIALQAENVDLELDLHSYERPLAVSPFGNPEHVPDWDETHAMALQTGPQSRLVKWIRTDSGARAFQGPGTNSLSREQVTRRITRDLHIHLLLESLDCESRPHVSLHRRCLPGCGYATPMTRDIETCFMYRVAPCVVSTPVRPPSDIASLLPSGGGGFTILFKIWCLCSQHSEHKDNVVHAIVHSGC